jgi:hypothetical protein
VETVNASKKVTTGWLPHGKRFLQIRNQDCGAKNARVRISMLSRGGASAVL